ncbi:MAG TPA: DUF6167 family protein [Jiangellaceae bacterium]
MSRLFWIAVGATAGVFVVRRVNRFTRRLSAGNGVSTALGGVSEAVREFVDDVKNGMADRDLELRHALGISTDGHPAPDGDPAAVEAVLRDPGRVRSPL